MKGVSSFVAMAEGQGLTVDGLFGVCYREDKKDEGARSWVTMHTILILS